MIIGITKLHELVKNDKLVENLCDREMNSPEGAGFDLRMAEVFELDEAGDNYFLGIEERNTPDIKSVAKIDDTSDEEKFFTFEPGKYYLIKTIESVNIPTTLSAIIFPRTTLFRSGLALFNGIGQPGYCGGLTFGICNLGKSKIKIALGARVVHITFHEVLGEGNQYKGQWQGGRVTTEKIEQQI
jgi:deoxycytidine triphosphate deaminase